MKVAIIGTGFGLDVHYPVINEIKNLKIVSISNNGSDKRLNLIPNNVHYFNSWKEVLNQPLDLVTIATPPIYHERMINYANKKNISIFCEKPMGLNFKEGNKINALMNSNKNNHLTINYEFRFDPGFKKIKNLLDKKVIGKLSEIKFVWLTSGANSVERLFTWRNDVKQGGGVIMNFLSHIIDLSLWFCKSSPKRVSGNSKILIPFRPDLNGKIQKVTADDFVKMKLEMNNNLKIYSKITNCNKKNVGMKAEFLGDEGKLVYQVTPPYFDLNKKLTLFKNNEISNVSINLTNKISFKDSRCSSTYLLFRSFIKKINENKNYGTPTSQDALRVHEVIDRLKLAISISEPITFE